MAKLTQLGKISNFIKQKSFMNNVQLIIKYIVYYNKNIDMGFV